MWEFMPKLLVSCGKDKQKPNPIKHLFRMKLRLPKQFQKIWNYVNSLSGHLISTGRKMNAKTVYP